jgi:adenine/guanine phosphoribosyltransferase-like PRPP-binding protein
MQRSQIPIDVFQKLQEIFLQQHWDIQNDPAFNDFCGALSFLNTEQQECVLDLTQKFLRVDLAFYPLYLRKTLQAINPDLLKGIKTVFVMPLMPKEDYGKSKSSNLTVQMLIGREVRAQDILGVNSVYLLNRIDELKMVVNSKDWLLLLVDDFIGTGETAEKALKDIMSECKIDFKRLIILALVSQKNGYETLINKGVNVVCTEIRKKGISDEYSEPVRQKYLALMNNIEDILKVKKDFRLGYKGSEALVTLNRTPNNTFPVYWREAKVNNKKFPAPFPRR